MGHSLQALITKFSILRDFASEYDNAIVVNLEVQSMGLLPLSFAFLDEIKPDEQKGEFPYTGLVRLTKHLETIILPLSNEYPIAYIQTEYFGGVGEQGAIAWHMEKIVYPPSIVWGIGPINMALKKLGVNQKDGLDEFDTLGLGKFRNIMSKYDTED
jgi:hypothetical protein